LSVAFCVGTGRCGTTFVSQLAGAEDEVAASHERLRLAATFHMYCSWHGISVDPGGFLVDRDAAVRRDLVDHRISFESSALLSHSIAALDTRFSPQWLLLVRRPDATVSSFSVRGWFEDLAPHGDPDLPPSYRQGEEPRHFFGRILPRGKEERDRFQTSTPLGRVAWFWQARNRAILKQLGELPASRVRIARLEDLDFEAWVEIAGFLGWSVSFSADEFRALADRRPNAGPNTPRSPAHWTERERREFEREVAEVAAALGYRHQLSTLEADGNARIRPAPTVAEALVRLHR